MKRLLLAAALLLLPGCYIDVKRPSDSELSDVMRGLEYFQDSNTKLCFAAVGSYTYGGAVAVSITNVPCESLSAVTVWRLPDASR